MSGQVVLMTLLGGLGTICRAGGRRADRHGDGELPGAVRRLGDRDPGRDLHALRAVLPQRRGRHDRRLVQAAAL